MPSVAVVARIATLVEHAGATKATTQPFIGIEQRYSVGMVAVILAVFAVPLLFGAAPRDSLLRAMTFMIVASPCAVVLATMPPLLAAIAKAGRNGVLVKSAIVIEQLRRRPNVAISSCQSGSRVCAWRVLKPEQLPRLRISTGGWRPVRASAVVGAVVLVWVRRPNASRTDRRSGAA